MTSISRWARAFEKQVADNSPAILTAWGVTGTLATAYLTGKASFKAAELIRQDMIFRDNDWKFKSEMGVPYEMAYPLAPADAARLVWKLYIPAACTGVVTIACIVAANRIGNRRAAAMAVAYSVSEKAFTEYKEKVVEQIGKNKEKKVRDEIAQDRVTANPPSQEVIVTGGDLDVLCYEMYTGRYFKSNMEELKAAQNAINHQIINHNYASLSDFYDRIGLNRTQVSEEMGWNLDKALELTFSTVMAENNQPALAFSYQVEPIRNYFRMH